VLFVPLHADVTPRLTFRAEFQARCRPDLNPIVKSVTPVSVDLLRAFKPIQHSMRDSKSTPCGMTKKKLKAPAVVEGGQDGSSPAEQAKGTSSSSQSNDKKTQEAPSPQPPALVICRNKYMAHSPVRGKAPWIGSSTSV
jgi:hypothetical protein